MHHREPATPALEHTHSPLLSGPRCLPPPFSYLERFLNYCGFAMTSANFRPVWLVSLLLATKMCDDRGLCNEDFAWMFPNLCTCRMVSECPFLKVVFLPFAVSCPDSLIFCCVPPLPPFPAELVGAFIRERAKLGVLHLCVSVCDVLLQVAAPAKQKEL